jgi:hypothetical protein
LLGVLSGSGPTIDQRGMAGQWIEGFEPQKIAEFAMDVLIEATSAPARKLTRADLANLSKPALKALLHQRLTPGSSVELARALHRLGDTSAAAKALRAHPLDHYNPSPLAFHRRGHNRAWLRRPDGCPAGAVFCEPVATGDDRCQGQNAGALDHQIRASAGRSNCSGCGALPAQE